MKIYKKYVFIFLVCIFCLLSIYIYSRYWKYSMYVPFFWEKIFAKQNNTPLEVFNKFQIALKAEDQKTYLQYITKETRDRYRDLLSDSEIRERYLEPLTNVQELYTVDCENKLTCERIAVYSYDYNISEPYWEEIMGKRYLIPSGTQKLEMTFVEIKKGYWQLNEF